MRAHQPQKLFLRSQLACLLLEVSNYDQRLGDLARPAGQQAPRTLLPAFLVLGFTGATCAPGFSPEC